MAWPVKDGDTCSSPSTQFEDSFVPFKRMPDSQTYLDRLENRLAKLKSAPLNSKAVLQGLHSLRESCHLDKDSTGDSPFVIEDTPVDMFSLERRLFPSKCLQNTEGQRLLDADVLAQTTVELSSKEEVNREIQR